MANLNGKYQGIGIMFSYDVKKNMLLVINQLKIEYKPVIIWFNLSEFLSLGAFVVGNNLDGNELDEENLRKEDVEFEPPVNQLVVI